MTTTAPRTDSFIVLSGPFRNVGDTVIRRRAVEWLQAVGTPHVYVGRGRERWVEDVIPDGPAVLYESFSSWASALLAAPRRTRALVLEPGEFSADGRFARPVGAAAALAVVVRSTGGTVLQLPRALAVGSPFWTRAYGVVTRRANLALWRDAGTARRFGRGVVVPDIAFDDPRARPQTFAGDRDLLTISLRGDRDAPDDSWYSTIRGVAADHCLEIQVVVQVESDGQRAREIAARLGASFVPWPGTTSSAEQEELLRSVYRRSTLTVSDRLHVVVLALVEGSLVAQVAMSPTAKIDRHTRAAGVLCPSYDMTVTDESTVRAGLRDLVARRVDAQERLATAVGRAAAARTAACTALTTGHGRLPGATVPGTGRASAVSP